MADPALELRARLRPRNTSMADTTHTDAKSGRPVTRAPSRVTKAKEIAAPKSRAKTAVPLPDARSRPGVIPGPRRKGGRSATCASASPPPTAIDSLCSITGDISMVTPPANAPVKQAWSASPGTCQCARRGVCGSSPDSGLSSSHDEPDPSPYSTFGSVAPREVEIVIPDKDRFQAWWEYLTHREQELPVSSDYLRHHPTLQERMRTILVEWMMEVCDEYKLHRETLQIAIHYVDRFLTVSTTQYTKSSLQLIGVSALFVASKIEEIYPPKLGEFAFVTDGACKKEDIVKMEMTLMQMLGWQLTPITPNAWVHFYMQLSEAVCLPRVPDFQATRRAFSTSLFVSIMHVIDLAILDIRYTRFLPSAVAATAMRFVYPPFSDPVRLHAITGYSGDSIAECVEWMRPFAEAAARLRFNPVDARAKINPDDCHNIQTFAPEMAATVYAIAAQANANEPLCEQIRMHGLTHL